MTARLRVTFEGVVLARPGPPAGKKIEERPNRGSEAREGEATSRDAPDRPK
jgi:hypothetical protein